MKSTLGCWVIVEDTKKPPSPFYSACQGLDSVRASLQILQVTVEKMKSLLGCWVIVEDMKSSLRCWVIVKDHEVIIRLLGPRGRHEVVTGMSVSYTHLTLPTNHRV